MSYTGSSRLHENLGEINMATRQDEKFRELQIGWWEQQDLEWEQCDGCWFCAPETAEDYRLNNEERARRGMMRIKPPLFIVPPPEPEELPLLVPLAFWLERLPVHL